MLKENSYKENLTRSPSRGRKQGRKVIEEIMEIKAIDVKKNSNNFFLNATVNEEYTEKLQIYWWSLEDLEMMIRNGGFINNDYFRAYFLPVLHRTIIELSELKKNV